MRWIGRIVAMAVVSAIGVAAQGCARHHGPRDSTETGNPPVIDAERVALFVQHDEVHVVGEEGAVKPGGATIHVTNLVSNKRASGRAAKDGSFDVKAPGGVNDGFSLQANNGDGDSKPVFVLQNVTTEGAGKDGALSCEQQTMAADVQTRAAVAAADTTCTQDDDCVSAETSTVCLSTCSWAAVSKAGQMLIESVVSSINEGLCRPHLEAGCDTGLRFCPSDPLPHMLICAQGHCMREGADAGTSDAGNDAGMLSCEQRLDAATAQQVQAENDADKNCSADADCVIAPAATGCSGGCPGGGAVVSIMGRMQVQDAIDAINAGVCAGYADDGCSLPIVDCGAPGTPACKQGQCEALRTCDERFTMAQAELLQASQSADKSCVKDADCDFAASAADCGGGCGYGAILSAAGRAQVDEVVAALNAGVCKGFGADGCAAPMSSCAAPPTPVCTQGQCTGVPAP